MQHFGTGKIMKSRYRYICIWDILFNSLSILTINNSVRIRNRFMLCWHSNSLGIYHHIFNSCEFDWFFNAGTNLLKVDKQFKIIYIWNATSIEFFSVTFGEKPCDMSVILRHCNIDKNRKSIYRSRKLDRMVIFRFSPVSIEYLESFIVHLRRTCSCNVQCPL